MRRDDYLSLFRSIPQKTGKKPYGIGMQPELRLLNAHNRWWVGATQDCQKAEASERFIGLMYIRCL